MEKIINQKAKIKNFLLTINDSEQYTTKYCKQNKLFISMVTGEYKDRILYIVIDSGLLKVRREVNGTSKKRCKLYFTGADLKSALKSFYNL
jgi:hypothetical protein